MIPKSGGGSGEEGVRGPGTPANEGLVRTQHYIDFNKMLHVYYTIIKTRENIIENF